MVAHRAPHPSDHLRQTQPGRLSAVYPRSDQPRSTLVMGLLRLLLVAGLALVAVGSAVAGDTPSRPAPVLTKAPELLSAVPPAYPAALQSAGVGGDVVVRILINPAGIVTSTELVTGVHPDLDAAALNAAAQLVFEPGEVDGEPAPIAIDYTFSFVPKTAVAALGSLAGRVFDHRKVPIQGVLVSIVDSDLEATTDAAGDWSIDDVPPGAVRIVLFHDEYQRTRETVEVGSDERRTFEAILLPSDPGNESIVVGRKRWREVQRAPLKPPEGAVVGTWEMTRRDVELAPGALGDVGRAVQQLPGVSGDGDLFATFNVRGGAASETLFYLDGVRMQNPNHLGGVFSMFNPNIAAGVRLHTSAPSADLGESLAGALEVDYIDADASEFDGVVDLNMAMGSAYFGGPIGKPGAPSTFLISARRSFLEPYFAVMRAAGVLSKQTDFGLAFGEYMGRITYSERGHRVRFTFLYGHDRMNFGVSEDAEDPALLQFSAALDARNRLYMGALDWRWDIGSRVQWRNLIALTHDEADQIQDAAFAVTRRVSTLRPSWRSDFRFLLDDAGTHTLRAGLEAAYTSMSGDGVIKDPRAVPTWAATPWADMGAFELAFNPRTEFVELGLYAEDDWRGFFGGPFDGRLGVRVTPLNATGRVLVSPRAGIALPLPTKTTLKGSFALTHQIPTDPLVYDPVAGATDLKPERAIQFSAAVEQLLPFGALIRVEAYHRILDHLLVNPDTVAAVQRGVSYQSVGKGTASGIDVFFGLRMKRFGVAASYSLGRAMRHNPLNEAGPQTFRPLFDQRHGLRIGGEATLGKKKRWVISGSWELRSGRPRSPVVHQLMDDGETWRTVLYDYNSRSLGTFHELSIRIEHSRVWKNRMKMSIYLDVMNTYNAQSQYQWIYGTGSVDEQTGSRVAPRPFIFRQLPIRPWLGYRFAF